MTSQQITAPRTTYVPGIVRQIIDCADEDEAKRRDAAETTQLERTGHYSIIVHPKEVD